MHHDLAFSPYDGAQASAVVDLWNRTFGEHYPLREELLRQNLDRNPNFRPTDAVMVRDGGELLGFGMLGRYRGDAPLCRTWLGRAWLAAAVVHPAAQRQGIGTRIYAWLTAHAGGISPGAVEPGGGTHRFFPGAPTDLPAARPFLESLGFRFGGTMHDVRADLASFRLPAESERLVAVHGLAVRPCGEHEVGRLSDFLASEFGAGWWYSADRFFRAGGAAADWLLLARDAEVVGMARLHHPGQAVIGAPRYWRHGPEAGGLGPIGVPRSLRGLGLGMALLHHTLAALQDRGVIDAVADWTDLPAFYAKAGFASWKRYAVAAR
ncbi:MAG: GNAT family N-acetyltransferase [Chloroflexota bacterium]|nr:GNAT family N-acetyltransferase [Chloroflexota bacterium]